MVAGVVVSILGAGGGIWVILIPFGIVGAVIAWRQPANPIGPLLLTTFARAVYKLA